MIAGAELVPDGIPGYKALYGEATTRELFLVQDSGKVYLAITALTQVLPIRDTGFYLTLSDDGSDFRLFNGNPSSNGVEVVNKTMPAQPAPAPAAAHETSLMTKVPAQPLPDELPKVLRWAGDRYVPTETSFRCEVYPASDARAKSNVDELKKWIPVAEEVGVTDGADVIRNIIEVIEGQDGEDLVLFLFDGGSRLLGAATYRMNERIEGADVPIPEQEGDFVYVQYRAANPETQVPADARVTGAPGGIGQALYAAIERHGLPVFTYTENAVSEASARRAGYGKMAKAE